MTTTATPNESTNRLSEIKRMPASRQGAAARELAASCLAQAEAYQSVLEDDAIGDDTRERVTEKQDTMLSVARDAQQIASATGHRPAVNPGDLGGALAGTDTGAAQWIDTKTGDPVMVLGKGQKLTDMIPGRKGSLGKAIKGMATGDWSGAEFEQSLSTTTNSAGGFLVPDALTANVIDLARNKSVLLSMGAQVFPMNAQSVTIARVTSGPTIENKAENAAFTGSDVAFDAINLNAHTLGAVITMSNELLQDSMNGSAAIENELAKALAVEIDRQLLVGTGSAEILGVANQSGIQTTGSISSIHWDNILNAMEDLMDVNAEATGYATTPLLATALDKLKTGDGTNAAANYLAAPPSVAALRRMTSNQIPTGHVYVADWSRVLVGVRLNATIEFSRDAGEAFDRYQTKIRSVWRGDSNIERADNFVKLTGATA